MNDNLNKATERLSKSMDKISASMDQVFLDINSTFVEMDKVFDEVDIMFDDMKPTGASIKGTINGQKIDLSVGKSEGISIVIEDDEIFVNGKKYSASSEQTKESPNVQENMESYVEPSFWNRFTKWWDSE
jgi:hypothetical protein